MNSETSGTRVFYGEAADAYAQGIKDGEEAAAKRAEAGRMNAKTERFYSDAMEIVQACRDGIDREFYGGDAPHDSNALTEVWPTSTGAGLTTQRHGRTFAVVVAPVEDVTVLARPDWGDWPGLWHPRGVCEAPGVCKFHPDTEAAP